MKRFIVISLIVLVAVVAGGALYIRHYLHSARVATEVTERVEALYGGPVHIGSVDVGVSSSSVHDFALFEPGSDAASGAPWLKVASLTANVSLWELVRGVAEPTLVTVDGATVLLRFDALGNLITRFPARPSGGSSQQGQLPELILENAEVVLRKQGQADLIVKNASVRLSHGDAGKMTLTGSADSPDLGKLALSGAIGPQLDIVVTVKTAGKTHVNQGLLNRLPLIPPSVWHELQINEGDSTAEVTVQRTSDGAIHFHAEANADNATINVPSLDLKLNAASGLIVVDDERLRLKDGRGKAYGGDIRIDAAADFSGPVLKLTASKVQIDNLNVSEVPDVWSVPGWARTTLAKGKLSGTASVELTVGPAVVSPGAADTLVGLLASPPDQRWLPAATALAALPQRTIHASSEGKGKIVDVSGGSAEFDMKLAPRGAHPVKTAPGKGASETSGATTIEPWLLALLATTVQGTPASQAYPDINVKLGRLTGQLLGGADDLLRGIVAVGSRLVAKVPKRVEPAPIRPPTPAAAGDYLDLNLKLKDVDIAQFVKGLGLKLGVDVQGKLSFQVKASIPSNTAGDLKAYKVKGSAQVKNLRIAGIKLDAVNADIKYSNGILELTALNGRFAAPTEKQKDPNAGTFHGSGTMRVVPLGAWDAALTLERIPLEAVAGLAGDNAKLGGAFSGQFTVHAPAGKFNDLAAIEGNGNITAPQLRAYGLTLADAAASLEIKGGVARLSQFTAKLEGTPVHASAELRLSGAYPLKAQLDLKNWDLAALQKLAGESIKSPVRVAGSFTTAAHLDGTLRPFKLAVFGDVAAAELRINDFNVSSVKFHWATDGNTAKVTGIDLKLYGGQITGAATLPLRDTAAGSVDLKLSKFDVKQLSKDLALPVKVEGMVEGQLKGSIPPAADGKPRTAVVDIDITAPKLRVQNIPAEKLHGKLDYKNGVVDYKLEGTSLGGTFELDGQIPTTAPPKKDSRKGRLRIENVRLSRLVAALHMQDTVPLTGRLSVELDFSHDTPDRMPKGQGKLRIDNLRMKGTGLETDLEGDLILTDGMLRLRELSGTIAEGSFSAGFTLRLRDLARSGFTVALDDVEAAELLAPWLGDKIKGPMQVRLRGTLGRTWHGTLDLELARGEVYGLAVTQWRLPARWAYAPTENRAQIDVTDSTAQAARGRINGKVSATWDNVLSVKGNVRLEGADLQTLARPFMGATQLGGGQATGRFDFAGDNVSSVNDLDGTLALSFNQAQALQVPVLSQLTPYLGMGPSTTFQRGELRARLERGVLRIQKFALAGGNLRVFIHGNASLAGSLNLNVIAKTGDLGLPSIQLGAIAIRLPTAGPAPLVLLEEASTLLSNRTINLEVTGTVRNPTIRPRPLPLLSAEALQFIVNRANLPISLNP
jgi:hypothetical protein